MPPAVVPVQTSRAGLITALIVSVIIAVAMIVVAVYFSEENSKLQHDLSGLQDKMKPLASESANSDPRVNALLAAREQPAFQGLATALDVSMAESDQLAKLVGGDMAPDKAAAQARAAVKAASDQINQLNQAKLVSFTLPQNASLMTAVSDLTAQVSQLANARQDLQTQLAASEQKNQQTIQAQKDLADQKDKLIQEANAKADAAEARAKQYQAEAAQANAALQNSANTGLRQLQTVNADLTKQLQAATKKISELTTFGERLKTRLRLSRPPTAEAVVQHADGSIIRLTDQQTVFINIGQHQHVTKGLTFEIYDKGKGIPPLGEGTADTNLPVGKASIEVFSVGPDTSECRIVKLEPGEQIAIGDPIVNLIFDPNTKYNFVVYGDFDLSHTGAATPTDTEIVKQKIREWGGNIQDPSQLSVNTDFLVMGQAPVVPQVTDPNDATEIDRQQKMRQRLDAYESMISKAIQLGVPVMNQNRFLYFIGYYDQAQR